MYIIIYICSTQFVQINIIIIDISSICYMSSYPPVKTPGWWSEKYKWMQFTAEQKMACKTLYR